VRRAALILSATLAAGAATAAERLIAQTPEMVAVTDAPPPCGEPVAVTIRAAEAGFFADRPRLQRTVDGVRAILTFECARIPAIAVTGEAGGATVFAGLAGDATGWLVEDAGAADRLAPPAPAFAVVGVAIGMTPAAVIDALQAEFGSRPAFDAAAGRIEAADGPPGPIDAEVPPAGARRLVGFFDEGTAPRLTSLTVRQSVDGDQRTDIAARLADRYGPPETREDAGGATVLGWGRGLPDGQGRALEARIEPREGLTVLTITAADPDAPAGPQHRARF
jgi:hypothetical protein